MHAEVEGYRAIIHGMKQSIVNRLLVVGGTGSLETTPGNQLLDSSDFPEEYKAEALAMREVLKLLKQEEELNWTFLCPSMNIEPGERTGKFRLGGDELIVDAKGESRISCEDYAMAMIDELETPKHVRLRFTVGY